MPGLHSQIRIAHEGSAKTQKRNPPAQAILWTCRYTWNAACYLLRRRIRFRTFVMALRERPIAVAGKGGSYILDPDFES